MVKAKNKFAFIVITLVGMLLLLGFASACHCGDGVVNQQSEECDLGALNGFLCWAGYGSSCAYCTSTCKLKTITNYCGDGIKQECEECDDGNSIDTDGCSNLCKINTPEPPEPTCDHDIAVRYNYTDTFNTGIGISEDNIWMNNLVTLTKDKTHSIKYRIENKKEADDNVHIIVKVDSNILSEYDKLINEYHPKTLDLDISNLQCNTYHTISINVTSDGNECNLSDNYASREIYVNCEIEPPTPACGNHITEGTEQCDDGNLVNGDGCSAICQLEQIPPTPACGNHITEGTEQCDGGNLVNGDGCSRVCYLENLSEPIKRNHFVQFCNVNWECSGWSECIDGTMTRQCTDTNNCNEEYNKPYETSECSEKVLSNVYIEKENSNSLWIILGIILLIVLLVILVNLFN